MRRGAELPILPVIPACPHFILYLWSIRDDVAASRAGIYGRKSTSISVNASSPNF
jgi:hypothetical protein